jgi:hypothetical protein
VPRVVAWQLPGGKYLLRKIKPGENTAKLYLRDGLEGPDKLLVDPEKLTLAPVDQGKGTNVVSGIAVSDDAKRAVVGIVPGGDELHGELHVIDMATGQELGDRSGHSAGGPLVPGYPWIGASSYVRLACGPRQLSDFCQTDQLDLFPVRHEALTSYTPTILVELAAQISRQDSIKRVGILCPHKYRCVHSCYNRMPP